MATVSAGCAHRRVPARADIELVSVTVASSKPDGGAWDDVGLAGKLLAVAEPSALKLAASAPLSAEVLALVVDALREQISTAALPDPSGTATLVSAEGARVVVLPEQANTYAPEFRATWRDVKLSRETRITLELVDADVWGSDPIGTVERTYEDLARAARAREVSQIPVVDREQHLRSVGVLVRRASEQ
jgi:hypothetical protein